MICRISLIILQVTTSQQLQVHLHPMVRENQDVIEEQGLQLQQLVAVSEVMSEIKESFAVTSVY